MRSVRLSCSRHLFMQRPCAQASLEKETAFLVAIESEDEEWVD